MRNVLVEHGVNKKLQKALGYSEPTIRKALKGITRSKIADRIRATAIKDFGGRTDRTERVVIHKR